MHPMFKGIRLVRKNISLLSSYINRNQKDKEFVFAYLQTKQNRVYDNSSAATIEIEHSQSDLSDIITENDTNQQSLRQVFCDLHKRYCIKTAVQEKSHDLLMVRIGNIVLWLYAVIIEFITYSNIIKPKHMASYVLFGTLYPLKNVIIIGYASGAAAYGISIEIYLIIPLIITNCILAVINCSLNHSGTRGSIVNMISTIVLFIGTELTHQNFKRFTYQQSYKLHYQAATRAMLRPFVYLAVTTMFLISPGLRAIYSAARFKCPYAYQINNDSSCNLIDIEQPMFGENDTCVPDFTAMVTGIEQLRIIRTISISSIAFYSMYNKAFLDITGRTSIIHKILLTLFFALICSVVTANIEPFGFKTLKRYFDGLEGIILIILIILLIYNLRKTCKHKNNVIMEANPTIFG